MTDYIVDKKLIHKAIKELPYIDFKLTLNYPTGNFFYDPWILKDEFKNTVWEEIISSIPLPKGEARIIKLIPGTCYFSHADIDDRWHLSLNDSHSYLVDIDNMCLHKTESNGIWYTMDASPIHSAVNFGNGDRYQIVIRQLLKHAILDTPIKIKIQAINPTDTYHYVFDQIFSPWLNHAVKHLKIDNFELDKKNSVIFDIDEKYTIELKNLAEKTNGMFEVKLI